MEDTTDDQANRAAAPPVKAKIEIEAKREVEAKSFSDGIMSKYEFVERLQIGDYAASNFSNSIEEERLLEYVESFRRQFIQLFPARQESLFLSPLNEFGVRKFVCSSIRPTLQKFVTLWHWRRCVEFVSQFMSYEPLKQETQFPDLLISNDILLRIRSGDCLDYSNLLCSLLRGAGYNAFIVYGVAKYHITHNDQSNDDVDAALLSTTAWPNDRDDVLDEEEDEEDIPSATQREKTAFEIPSFYEMSASRKNGGGGDKLKNAPHQRYAEYLAEKEAELAKLKQSELSKLNSIQRKELFDPLRLRRVHFWVLVKGGLRGMDAPDFKEFFIEPVTGNVFDTDTAAAELPFLRIESVWNDKNYWVSVQDANLPIAQMSFDLGDTKSWEFVLFDENKAKDKDSAESAADKDKEETEKEESEKEILHLPRSWMQPFFLSQHDMDHRFPRHSVSRHFSKCSIVYYDRFFSKNGLVLKMTLFADNTKLVMLEMRELFRDRKDLLLRRVSKMQRADDPSGHSIVLELFDIGRPSGLYKLINVSQRRRVTKFYADSRSDGMVRRTEIFGEKVVELFADRNDGIIARKIYLLPARAVGAEAKSESESESESEKVKICFAGDASLEFAIERIEEHYSYGANAGNADNIRLLTFGIARNEYVVDFHYGANRILSKQCTFAKESGSVVGWDPNPLSAKPNTVALKRQFEKLIVAEKNLLTEIRERERTFGVLLAKIEEQRKFKGRDALKKDALTQSKEVQRQPTTTTTSAVSTKEKPGPTVAAAAKETAQYSMLNSFLPKSVKQGAAENNLNREQIDQIKEDCLRSLKERLVQRLNIITKRLHSEIQCLEKEKTKFEAWQNSAEQAAQTQTQQTQTQDLQNIEREQRFKAFKKEIEFKIKIIKQRLAKHEQSSIQKMNQLSDLLDSYPNFQ